MKQVLDLAGWPPQGGSGAFDSRAAAFVTSPEQVIIRKVDRVVANRVDMTCVFESGVVTFRYFAPDRGSAESMAAMIEANRGKSLQFVGMLIAPEDNQI
jgi:hypothetical protein